MLFATALTSTIVVICTAPRAVFSTETAPSSDENVIRDTPSEYYCNSSLDCPGHYGSRKCENHVCTCHENFYQVHNHTTGVTYCHLCSLFQESCAVTKCCHNPQTTYCSDENVCICKPGLEEECLSMIYRGRYSPTLGIQLANTLSVSFAFVFLAITFIAVIRKMLFGCSYFRCDSMSRVASNSSLNEFVKQKMQNRPPCYDDIDKDRKVPIDVHRPPPEYGAVHFGRPNTSFRGVLNPCLSISDEVEMNNTAPPNYSTFTTVTDVGATTAAGQTNGEIILTQPIYANRVGSPRFARR